MRAPPPGAATVGAPETQPPGTTAAPAFGDDGAPPSAVDASLTPTVFGNGPGGAPGSCLGLGAGCSAAADCCSGDCTGGACTYPACTSDHGACTSDGNCCSQSCVGGACAALNTTCHTLGNQCTASAQCCSNLCSNGTCQASSFCGQGGDSCATAADCCTQQCTIAAGAKLGTCGATPPGGPANCGVVDGQLCGGTAPDGGIVLNAGGLPSCGGPCCSRACAPWGPTGVLVCQPASGCHVVGDLCTHRLRLLRLGGPARRLRKAGHVRHHRAVDGRRLPQPDGLQARRRRVQAQDDVVQLVVRLLRRQLRDQGHLQAGQRGRPAVRGGPVRRRGRSVRFERELLQRDAVRPEPRRRRHAASSCAPAPRASARAAPAPTRRTAAAERPASSPREAPTASVVPAEAAGATTAARADPVTAAVPEALRTPAAAGRWPDLHALRPALHERSRSAATACRATVAASSRRRAEGGRPSAPELSPGRGLLLGRARAACERE